MVNRPQPAAQDRAARTSVGAQRLTLKPSKQTCIILGGLMLAVILGGVGLYFWQSGEIAAKQAVLDQKRKEVAQGEEIARQLAQLETEYATMQSQLRFLESSVESREFAPTMVKQLEDEARRVNLSFNAFRNNIERQPPPPADKEALKTYKPWGYDKLHVDVELTGSYWNLARFLYRLTEFRKIVAVENVSISPRMDGAEYRSMLSVRMNLTGFIFPVEEQRRTQPVSGRPITEPSETPEVKQAVQNNAGDRA